jgi:hypothetical protein
LIVETSCLTVERLEMAFSFACVLMAHRPQARAKAAGGESTIVMSALNSNSRFRLRTLILIVAVVGTALGLYGRYYYQPTYVVKHFSIGSTDGTACWRVERLSSAPPRLEYAVIFPNGTDHTRGMGVRTNPMPQGVYCVGATLYMNGQPMETSGVSRLFVYEIGHTLAKLEVSQQEFELIERSQFGNELRKSRYWQERLFPQIQRHASPAISQSQG